MPTSKVHHGTGKAIWYSGCHCPSCLRKKAAVQRLVESFSQLPARWFEQIDRDGRPVPMWGTLFIPQDSADIRGIEELLREIDVPTDSEGNPYDDSEEAMFRDADWQEVADTGIYATMLDDELVLGINGAGYSFYAEHWSKLYDVLGYHWHELE